MIKVIHHINFMNKIIRVYCYIREKNKINNTIIKYSDNSDNNNISIKTEMKK